MSGLFYNRRKIPFGSAKKESSVAHTLEWTKRRESVDLGKRVDNAFLTSARKIDSLHGTFTNKTFKERFPVHAEVMEDLREKFRPLHNEYQTGIKADEQEPATPEPKQSAGP